MIGRIAVFTIVVAAALAWWFYEPDPLAAKPDSVRLDDEPALSIENGKITEHRPSGERKFELSFASARDFASKGEALVERPSVRYFPMEGDAWHLTAHSGILRYSTPELPDGENRLDLQEDVHIEARDPDGYAFELRSQHIEVLLEDERIRGSGSVRLEGSSFTATAASMAYAWTSRSIRLLGDSREQVHVVFNPNSSP